MAGRIPHADTSKGNGFRRLVDSICRKMFVGTDRTEERGHHSGRGRIKHRPGSAKPTDGFRPIPIDNLAQLRRYFIQRLFQGRSEEHTSELQSLMRISYAVFCLKKNK